MLEKNYSCPFLFPDILTHHLMQMLHNILAFVIDMKVKIIFVKSYSFYDNHCFTSIQHNRPMI